MNPIFWAGLLAFGLFLIYLDRHREIVDMGWFDDRKKDKKHEQKGTLIIEKAGADEVTLPLGFKPHVVEAGFASGSDKKYQTCAPAPTDFIESFVMGEGIKLVWRVSGPRTIKWMATRGR